MEFPIDYTDCQQYTDYSGGTYEDQSCANVTAAARHAGKSSDCKCRILLSIDRNVSVSLTTYCFSCIPAFTSYIFHPFLQGPVYIYYGLDNFFQNHRKYVKSRDDTQLMGSFENDLGKSAPSPDCAPFAMANATFGYAPCGAVANSLFNGWSNFLTLRSISLRKNSFTIWKTFFSVKNFEPFNDVAHFTCL